MITFNQDLNRYEASHEVDLEDTEIFVDGPKWCQGGVCTISDELLAELEALDQDDQEEF